MLAEVEITTQFRCNRCWQLEERGIRTRLCNVCGYAAGTPAHRPNDTSHEAGLGRAHEEVLSLTPQERERYDYWMELGLAAGWERPLARRAAFARARPCVH